MRYFILTFLVFYAFFLEAQKVPFTMKELNYGQTEKWVSLDHDIHIAYVEEGAGDETILFIHGLASYIPAWKKNMADLKTSYRCIALDLPGYGKSSKGNYPVSMDFFAETIQQFCTQLGLEKVVIAGHSMGGQIAITTALKFPDLVSKLILIAPAGFETFNKGERQWFRDVSTADGVRLTTVERIRVNYAFNFYNMPDDAQFMVDDRIKIRTATDFADYCNHVTLGVNAMVDSPVFDFLPQVKQPSLCIFGANDNLIPNRYLNGGKTEKFAREGAERMPDCSLHLIKKGGHFIMFEKSTEVNQLIRGFMKG